MDEEAIRKLSGIEKDEFGFVKYESNVDAEIAQLSKEIPQKQFGYCGKGVGEYKNWSISGCCSLCNFTKEKIKDMIDKRIKEDNEEVNNNGKI